LADGVDGEADFVAIAAEVSEDDVAQARCADAGGEVAGGAVREMSVRGHDALFDGEGALGVGVEHLLVVVGLDEEAVDAGDVMDDGMVDVTEIGEDADREGTAADGEADGVGGVMGHGESGDFEGLELKGAAGAEEAPLGGGVARVLGADFVGGQARGVDRAAQGAQKDGEAAGVIAVFVGEQDGGNLRGVEAGGGETGEGFFGAQSGINEDGGVAGAQDGCVAAAAAAEDDQFHGAA